MDSGFGDASLPPKSGIGLEQEVPIVKHAHGYSGKPLAAKLGIKIGDRVWVLSAPPDYLTWVGDCGALVELNVDRPSGSPDLIHMFCADSDKLNVQIERVSPFLVRGVVLWVSWLKGAHKGEARPNREAVRRAVLEVTDFVDVKVAAISKEWSGLKFLMRRSTA
ncbi:MAG: DUF3052 domain-containing protein [Pseudomonadota bacterium]